MMQRSKTWLRTIFRGYYPRGGGEVRITINPVDRLNAVDLTEFGQIKRFFGRAFVSGTLSKRVGQHSFSLSVSLLNIHTSSLLMKWLKQLKN